MIINRLKDLKLYIKDFKIVNIRRVNYKNSKLITIEILKDKLIYRLLARAECGEFNFFCVKIVKNRTEYSQIAEIKIDDIFFTDFEKREKIAEKLKELVGITEDKGIINE